MVAPFSHFYIKFWVGLCLNKEKHFVLERAQVFLKNSTRDFQNSPPFERLTSFYVTMTGNFDRFQYFHFEQYFLKTKNFFKKLEYCLLFKSTKIGNTTFPYKNNLSGVNIKPNKMGPTKWTYHEEQHFANNCFIFLKILFQYKNLL